MIERSELLAVLRRGVAPLVAPQPAVTPSWRAWVEVGGGAGRDGGPGSALTYSWNTDCPG